MGFKLFIGQCITSAVDGLIRIDYRLAAFIPNGRILELDLKRAKVNPACIFDVGANHGQTAVSYRRHFPGAAIYSFEPVEESYQQLLKNTSAEGVKCFNIALGAETGNATIYKSETYSGISSLNGANEKDLPVEEKINISTGEAFCREQNINAIDLLKIDTEGYETEVLQGFGSMIKNNVRFIYLETGFDPNDPFKTYLVDVIKFLNDKGFTLSGFYNPFWYGGNKLKLNHCDVLFTNTILVNAL